MDYSPPSTLAKDIGAVQENAIILVGGGRKLAALWDGITKFRT